MLTGFRRFQVAVSRFIDDVSNLAIEDRLISKLSTLFRSSNVLEMSVEDVSILAGETQESSLERQRLETKRKILRTGLQSLKSLNKRRSTPSPTKRSEVESEDSPRIYAMTPNESEEESMTTSSPKACRQATSSGGLSHSLDTTGTDQPFDGWPTQVGFDGKWTFGLAQSKEKREF